MKFYDSLPKTTTLSLMNAHFYVISAIFYCPFTACFLINHTDSIFYYLISSIKVRSIGNCT
jgi:hypothetical protein